jgi:hypothetical protein
MRRTALLLILVFLVLSPACVAGWGGEPVSACSTARRSCTEVKAKTIKIAPPACSHVRKSQPNRCGLRSFVQLQFMEVRSAVDVFVPPLRLAEYISPARFVIIISSIGPPETDRGPPRS